MIHDTQSAQISQKQDGRNIYVIMKTMCPPGYHHNGSVAEYLSVFSPNTGKYGPEITPYLDTFHAVLVSAWPISRDIILNVIYNKILCYLTSVGLCTSDF